MHLVGLIYLTVYERLKCHTVRSSSNSLYLQGQNIQYQLNSQLCNALVLTMVPRNIVQ